VTLRDVAVRVGVHTSLLNYYFHEKRSDQAGRSQVHGRRIRVTQSRLKFNWRILR